MSEHTPEHVPQEKRFCKTCGLWFGEFMACEEMDCELETSEEAWERIQRKAKGQPQ